MEALMLLIGFGAFFFGGVRYGRYQTCRHIKANRNNPGFVRRMILDGTVAPIRF